MYCSLCGRGEPAGNHDSTILLFNSLIWQEMRKLSELQSGYLYWEYRKKIGNMEEGISQWSPWIRAAYVTCSNFNFRMYSSGAPAIRRIESERTSSRVLREGKSISALRNFVRCWNILFRKTTPRYRLGRPFSGDEDRETPRGPWSSKAGWSKRQATRLLRRSAVRYRASKST